ncbi:MAG: hypothetical protein M1546_27930 [Chloroflexi bacterium]|nr:hypothetical protein [Chloroflexota bacterium]
MTESQIAGIFRGWEGNGMYILANGQVWKQAQYRYEQNSLLNPTARVWSDDDRFYLEVAGMPDRIEVRPLTADVAEPIGGAPHRREG